MTLHIQFKCRGQKPLTLSWRQKGGSPIHLTQTPKGHCPVQWARCSAFRWGFTVAPERTSVEEAHHEFLAQGHIAGAQK